LTVSLVHVSVLLPLYLSGVGLLGYAMCYVLCCIFHIGMDTPAPGFQLF